MKKKTIRKWLNPPSSHNNGWINFSIDAQSYGCDVDLTIADCSRQITLDLGFSSHSRISKAQSLKKMNIIIDALTEIRDCYDEFYDHHKEKLKESRNSSKISELSL